jgi:hypothetical protein
MPLEIIANITTQIKTDADINSFNEFFENLLITTLEIRFYMLVNACAKVVGVDNDQVIYYNQTDNLGVGNVFKVIKISHYGGDANKVKVLGRLRKIHNDGRNKFIVYQKQRLSLAEAKKLEDHQRSHSMPKKTTPKKTTTPEKTTPKKTTTPEKSTPKKITPKKTTPEKTTSKKTRPVSVSRTS